MNLKRNKHIKINKRIKINKLPYILAFLIPFTAYTILLIANKVYPFGDNCILHIDMMHQYFPFFTEFANKLKEGDSLLYSWNVGLGSDFVALYTYYLVCPLNWLLLIWPSDYIIEFMTLLIMLKTAGCGLTFFIYLTKHFQLEKKDGVYPMQTAVIALACALAYAFSGFMAAYYWNIMWLDGVMLFPLIVLGMERLAMQGKPMLYFVTLALSILCNYYISIMICIFLYFYFLVVYLENKEMNLRRAFSFAGYSLLAAGCAAVLLLPEISILSTSGSSYSGFTDAVEWYFSGIQELSRSCFATEVYTTGDGDWPNLYAGVFAVFLLIMYALNRKIPVKKRVVRIAAVIFFLVSFANNYLDYLWNGMHERSQLPGRQAFLYVFLLLVLAFEALHKWRGNDIWDIIISGSACLIFLLLVTYYGGAEGVSQESVRISGILVIVYALLFALLQKTSARKRKLFFGLFAVIAMAEIIVNFAMTGIYTTSRSTFLAKVDDYERLLEMAEEESAGEFYRVEDTERKTKNDSCIYGYRSASVFSSLMNGAVGQLYKSVRMEGGKNSSSYNGQTPLLSAMLSVKYFLSDNAEGENALRTLVGQSGSYYLYENQYCLPLGFVVPQGLDESWDNSGSDYIANINSLGVLLGAEENLLKPVEADVEISSGSTAVTAEEDGYYYAYYSDCGEAGTLTVFAPNGGRTKYSKAGRKYLLELGELHAGETVRITNNASEEISYTIYSLNMDALDAAYNNLNSQTMDLVTCTSTRIEGRIAVEETGDLFLSIPAESGWALYVDGEETAWDTFKGAFITVELPVGTHEIVLVYHTPYLGVGAVISILCALVGIFFSMKKIC